MYKNILVPVAFETGRDTMKSIEIAEAIAGADGRVTALHVVEEVPTYVAQYLPEGQMAANIKEIEDILAERLGGHDRIAVKVIEGHAGHSIVDYASEHNCDCIVIASHRPGLQDLFLGSTAARVVRHAPCSVHVVR
ncbi:universal stress protein [Maritimibacter sp. HL-12]|jgi:universal stress protein F|uniref:universal stress protein n=1 Tax=Maritimibacter sp. HL-12 TaxID=1162418 RepID=UPI000A0F2833|nr:universal stress protein [Maritimibacter sp. HL-12]SMH32787.1 Nucleotide-binding universal stress protein, UspA family [Maritimibacter sp. HL-12]